MLTFVLRDTFHCIGSIPTSLPGLSKLHDVRRRGHSGGDPLDVVAPQVERVALLGVKRERV